MTHSNLAEFAENPSTFHQRDVEIEGTVERVFSDSLALSFWRFIRRWLVCRLFPGQSQNHLQNHQRFLISSHALRKGEWLMVEHNISFGALRLRRGLKVVVRGEYIHRLTHRRAAGKRVLNTYGVLHFTHPPRGYVEILR